MVSDDIKPKARELLSLPREIGKSPEDVSRSWPHRAFGPTCSTARLTQPRCQRGLVRHWLTARPLVPRTRQSQQGGVRWRSGTFHRRHPQRGGPILSRRPYGPYLTNSGIKPPFRQHRPRRDHADQAFTLIDALAREDRSAAPRARARARMRAGEAGAEGNPSGEEKKRRSLARPSRRTWKLSDWRSSPPPYLSVILKNPYQAAPSRPSLPRNVLAFIARTKARPRARDRACLRLRPDRAARGRAARAQDEGMSPGARSAPRRDPALGRAPGHHASRQGRRAYRRADEWTRGSRRSAARSHSHSRKAARWKPRFPSTARFSAPRERPRN